MIIDCHGHISAPPELQNFRNALLEGRGRPGRPEFKVSDDQVRDAYFAKRPNFLNLSHIEHLDAGGIDLQLLSPRPISMMQSEEPPIVVHWWTEELNNLIYRACQCFPGRFLGVGGLPSAVGTEPKEWIGELRRCVNELGFVGTLLNTDPGEGRFPPSPGLSDRFWYPLYEELCNLDIPAFIHSTNCMAPARETYGTHFVLEETVAVVELIESDVLDDFPDLRVIVSHGGGAIPYQVGRYEAMNIHDVFGPGKRDWREKMAKLWFDTCLYAKPSLECLFATVGTEHTCFGTEKPGTGSQINERTGAPYDDIKPLIEDISWLTDADRAGIFENNSRALFKLDGLLPA